MSGKVELVSTSQRSDMKPTGTCGQADVKFEGMRKGSNMKFMVTCGWLDMTDPGQRKTTFNNLSMNCYAMCYMAHTFILRNSLIRVEAVSIRKYSR